MFSANRLESTFFCNLSDAVVALVGYKKLPTGMDADALRLIEPCGAPNAINIPWGSCT